MNPITNPIARAIVKSGITSDREDWFPAPARRRAARGSTMHRTEAPARQGFKDYPRPRIAKVVDPPSLFPVWVPASTLADVRRLVCPRWVRTVLSIERTAMTCTHFAKEQVLFREGDPADSVFRLLSGAVDILRELDGDPVLLGTVGAGQFIGEMGVVESRPRSATARASSEVEVEILTPTEFLDQIARSPRAARELIQRLSQRLREADDRIVNDERRSG